MHLFSVMLKCQKMGQYWEDYLFEKQFLNELPLDAILTI
jgi:hypothetical protein